MKILVVGGGGREHATVKSLAKEGRQLFCAPGNAGIANLATCVDIKTNDVEGIVKFAVENEIDLAVVSQDEPLVLGMVDALQAAGIRAFGPNKAAAIIEGSKAFSKDLMKKYNIPTAAYEKFTEVEPAIAYLQAQNSYPAVIKASGLALGKGVIIAENFEDAKEAVIEMLEGGKFGESGSEIVIEEFLTGTEVSVLAFTDGKCIKPLTSAKDHKRALDGDKGLNTGGMGVIAPNPVYTKDVEERAINEIMIPTMEAMNKEGRTFKGVLYFGLIITEEGPKVIEYNCRFGDPETQVVLPLLKSDLLTIMQAVSAGKLAETPVEFSDGAACCVVMASGGYPGSYEKGHVITIPEGLNAQVFVAGAALKDDQLVTSGGRVLGVTATADTLAEAVALAYKDVEKISFEKAFYRRDIGRRALEV